jgi:hypothetical protein
MIQRSNDVPSASLYGGVLMMSIERGQYFSLNGVGSRIWELLERPTDTAAIVERLAGEYDVTPDVCAGQVEGFLAKLRERGLVVELD